MWVHREHHSSTAPGGLKRRCRESTLGASAAGEDELAIAHGHAMEFWRVLQAEEAAFEPAARRKVTHHRRNVTSNALHTSRRVQFGEETNQHALSLPSAVG